VHPKIVSEMLGHSTVAITLDLYSHVTPTMQRSHWPSASPFRAARTGTNAMAATAKRVRVADGEGGIRQRPSGRWEARAAVVDAAGRLHRRSVTADTERDAKRRLRELIAQHEAGIIAPDARETMARFLTNWLEGVKPTLRPRSWDRYEEHVRLHLIHTVGRIPLARL
jgi:hypothetical protein